MKSLHSNPEKQRLNDKSWLNDEDGGADLQLDTTDQRDAFVDMLRRSKKLLDKKEFKEYVRSRYPKLDLSKIMLSYSKTVVPDNEEDVRARRERRLSDVYWQELRKIWTETAAELAYDRDIRQRVLSDLGWQELRMICDSNSYWFDRKWSPDKPVWVHDEDWKRLRNCFSATAKFGNPEWMNDEYWEQLRKMWTKTENVLQTDGGAGLQLETIEKRENFVNNLRRNSMLVNRKQFKLYVKAIYPKADLSKIMLAYSKIVANEKEKANDDKEDAKEISQIVDVRNE